MALVCLQPLKLMRELSLLLLLLLTPTLLLFQGAD
jgi:hypothetical protein